MRPKNAVTQTSNRKPHPYMWLLPPVVLAVFLSGCSARTVYVPDGTPVRLRETIRNAKVWVLGEDGKPVAGEMDIPEGWYALPVAGDE